MPDDPQPQSDLLFKTLIRHVRQERSAALLAALVLLLVLSPLADVAPARAVFIILLNFVVLVGAVLTMSHRRRDMIIGAGLGTLALLAHLYAALDEVPGVTKVGALCSLPFHIYILGVVATYALRPGRVTLDTLYGAGCIYLLLGLIWASFYEFIEAFSPGSFVANYTSGDTPITDLDLMYYSLVTLTTLGYGDIVPVTRQGQALASLEAVTGVLFSALIVARVVGLYGLDKARHQSN